MPKRATRLLDDRLVPAAKSPVTKSEKRFSAVFLLFINGSTTPVHDERVIEAANATVALKIARAMCDNPSVFPAGCVARIPEKNISPLPDGVRMRRYQAILEVYRLGDRNRRPHLLPRNIDAPSRKDAVAKARELCENALRLPGVNASDLVRCPEKNVRLLKR